MMLAISTAAIAAFVVLLPLAGGGRLLPRLLARQALLVISVVVAVVAAVDGALVVAAAAVLCGLVLHLVGAGTRDGRLWLGLAALAAAVVVGGIVVGRTDVAVVASLLALALRAGVVPLHPGVAAIAERQPALLMELFGSAIPAVLLHLQLVGPAPDDMHDAARALASDLAVPVVFIGAGAALIGALLAVAQSTLRGLWSASVTMHAGMLFAAVGAAGRGHTVAAVLVVVTLALAMGGFGFVVTALEARVGRVGLAGPGGRVRAFPTLAAAFAVFAGAGVGLPGTAGFIADDLLLHALWEEGAIAAGIVVVASATLAVTLLRGYGAVFLGPATQRHLAVDLSRQERVVVAALLVALVVIGLFPMLIVGPADVALGR